MEFDNVPRLDAQPESTSSHSDNADILDEFLDRRLYEDQSYKQQVGDQINEEAFQSFLADDMPNDFLFGNEQTMDAFELKGNEQFLLSASQINSMANGHLGPSQIADINATTPTSIDMVSPPGSAQSHDVFTTPTGVPVDKPSPGQSGYESARAILSQLKFGREVPAQFNNEFPKTLLDGSTGSLPYQLTVENLPAFSRVETQIKLKLSISPPPPQFLVHLPADTIAKQKLCLSAPFSQEARDSMLFLETYVLTSSDKPCNICSKCLRREQKRASRRKSGVSDNMNWMTNANKRAIIFNCKEVISFHAASSGNARSVELSSRIVCYCRHHSEPTGFKLLFVLTNGQGTIVAKHFSSPIMIMDRKKSADDGTNSTLCNSANESSIISRHSSQPISPTSIEDDSSEPQTSDGRVFKRKKTWSPELSDGFSIAPSRKPSGSIVKREPVPRSHSSADMGSQFQIPQNQQQLSQQSLQQALLNSQLPVIQRVIPAQGPLRGGIEVTLLGSNFKEGLTVKFGLNKALSTQCWSETTMVTYLPPAAQPGQVVVTIEDPQTNQKTGSAVFTYLDDTDRQMIELALQIVGLKMHGKLEDARNIARKIIGSDGSGTGSVNGGSSQDTPMTGFGDDSFNSMNNGTDEDLILRVINLLQARPNFSLCTAEGQTLLHLSALKGYRRLVSSLLHKGARVDSKDIAGYTPLHYASLAGDRTSIELLLNCKAKIDAKTDYGLTPEDVADSNVLDIFKYHSSVMSRKFSSTSISSIMSIEDDQLDICGAHVSRMTTDGLTDSGETDYLDSDNSSVEASNEESGEDWDEEEISTDDLPNSSQSADLSPKTRDGSLWNKVRNVFQAGSDMDDLPRYDDLFPLKPQFSLPKLRFSTLTTGSSSATQDINTSGDESEDVFMKFFNQRKNVQNDKMLLFFWLPLLICIMSAFILHSTGWSFSWTDDFQDFMRNGVSKVMLGNERVKVALNKHFSQGYQAMTSVINS